MRSAVRSITRISPFRGMRLFSTASTFSNVILALSSRMGRDGKKRVLACFSKSGRENLEDWKLILRGLIERGLRRVLIVVQDDFSGLLPITKSLFPGADVQVCAVHMQRNARNHLSKVDSAEFQQRWHAVKSTWD